MSTWIPKWCRRRRQRRCANNSPIWPDPKPIAHRDEISRSGIPHFDLNTGYLKTGTQPERSTSKPAPTARSGTSRQDRRAGRTGRQDKQTWRASPPCHYSQIQADIQAKELRSKFSVLVWCSSRKSWTCLVETGRLLNFLTQLLQACRLGPRSNIMDTLWIHTTSTVSHVHVPSTSSKLSDDVSMLSLTVDGIL